MGTTTRALCLRQAPDMRPQGAARHLRNALGLWVHRYCAGFPLPWQSRDGDVAIPAAARTNPTTTSMIVIVLDVPPSAPTYPTSIEMKSS